MPSQAQLQYARVTHPLVTKQLVPFSVFVCMPPLASHCYCHMDASHTTVLIVSNLKGVTQVASAHFMSCQDAIQSCMFLIASWGASSSRNVRACMRVRPMSYEARMHAIDA